MNGNKALLDSNIIVYLSKNLVKTEDLFEKYSIFNISIITYIETLGYEFTEKSEKELVRNFLNSMNIFSVNRKIAEYVIKYRRNFRIKIPDAIILATAASTESVLVTNNAKDFLGIDSNVSIEVLKP